jgi:hypothetical protein
LKKQNLQKNEFEAEEKFWNKWFWIGRRQMELVNHSKSLYFSNSTYRKKRKTSCIFTGCPSHWKSRFLKIQWAGQKWLMPVILATQEAEIGKSSLWRPPWANSSWDYTILKIPNTKQSWCSGSSGRTPASQAQALNSNPSTPNK